MAKRTVLTSDLSQDEIAEGTGAQVLIRFTDARKGVIALDVTEAEAEEMGKSGRRQQRRGRKAQSGGAAKKEGLKVA